MKAAAGAVGIALALALTGAALADGYGVAPYHWVYPPPFQRLTNIQPTGTSQMISLRTSSAAISTSDAQVDVEINAAGTFGYPHQQKGIRITIRPLRHYHVPSSPDSRLDGNVYGLGFRYLPSGRVAIRASKEILITMDAPHNTPSNVMMGRFGNRWKPVCPKTTIIYVAGLPACLTKRLPNQAAIFYCPTSHFGVSGPTCAGRKSRGPSAFIIVAVVIVALWVALIVFLLLRGWLPAPGRRR